MVKNNIMTNLKLANIIISSYTDKDPKTKSNLAFIVNNFNNNENY